METILQHAQGLVYSLLGLMPNIAYSSLSIAIPLEACEATAPSQSAKSSSPLALY